MSTIFDSRNFIQVTSPVADQVSEAEFARTLGLPGVHAINNHLQILMNQARKIFEEISKHWIHTQAIKISAITDDKICFANGIDFTCELLAQRLHKAGAHMIVMAAVSLGPEIVEHCNMLWEEDKPDEAFVLDSLGTNVVEQLTLRMGIQLCKWGEPLGMAALPHYSPGYTGWDVREHFLIFPMLEEEKPFPKPLEVLESGMLKPMKSQVSIFGITRYANRIERAPSLCPCVDCSLKRCAYRRVPQKDLNAKLMEKRFRKNRIKK